MRTQQKEKSSISEQKNSASPAPSVSPASPAPTLPFKILPGGSLWNLETGRISIKVDKATIEDIRDMLNHQDQNMRLHGLLAVKKLVEMREESESQLESALSTELRFVRNQDLPKISEIKLSSSEEFQNKKNMRANDITNSGFQGRELAELLALQCQGRAVSATAPQLSTFGIFGASLSSSASSEASLSASSSSSSSSMDDNSPKSLSL